ncbi:PDZ domain-containing protein [Actinoplanes sp. N902-109]|uniref:YlbL family protein n=1 Tax=Actinoplanes sp. (strain N902-109) TaxID=649831 RepID=UPI0003295775|nr:S16 family serine protease [Actinoplanes sp. N902-109]AGL18798.1 secreted protein [Actinoplanes sp. N902-109]
MGTNRRGVLLLVGALVTALLGLAVGTFPLPYVALEPGPTVDTLGTDQGKEVITVTGADVSDSAGQLRLTTIQVRTRLSLGQAIDAWTDSGRAMVPRDVVYPPGQTTQEIDRKNSQDFKDSETSAEKIAREKIGKPFQVSFDLDRIGGPSAGLMFTLGIIDKLTPADLTGGRIIAGTGTIDDAGTVGRIGGIPQKLLGAKAAGAQLFLVPAGNCAEAARNAVPGLPMAEVGTVDDALTALRTFAAGGLPRQCATD